MATFKEIDDFFDKLTEGFFKENVPKIISENAIAFFKDRFKTKEWDGEPWPPQKIKRGQLMVKSSDLVNSIKEKSRSPERVVISAGSDKVVYARIHNEGGVIDHPGGTSFFLDKEDKKKAIFVSKEKAFAWAQKHGHELPKTKPHKIPIPVRRFMGPSPKLNDALFNALRDAFNKL